MPELPEVESVRIGLARHLAGARVTAVTVRDARSLRRQPGGAEAFTSALQGRTVLGAARRGKLLWLPLDDGQALTAHLGMSGQLLVRRPGEDLVREPSARAVPGAPSSLPGTAEGHPTTLPAHLRVRLALTSQTGADIGLDLVDQRVFGGMWMSPLVPTRDGAPGGEGSEEATLPASATGLARDLLDPYLDRRAAIARMRSSRRAVKAVLMDQQVVSGVGNIYADEGLWAAGLHARRRSCDLGPRVVGRLLTCTEEVMRRALEVGGTSFDALYVNADGEAGYFARSLAAYGRAGQPCQRCGTELRRETIGGRSHTFCPRCQTRPRGGV